MLSTVIKRGITIVGIALLSTNQGFAAPKSSGEEIAVVASLYKAFAWQAISGADAIFGKQLAQQEDPILRRYFDPELASLLIEDQRCIKRTREVCKLGFDPIFASQDLGVSDLSIASQGRGLVSVEFTYPSNGEKARLEYRLVKRGKDWRIGDIRYRQWDNASLKQMLSTKLPHLDTRHSGSTAHMPAEQGGAHR